MDVDENDSKRVDDEYLNDSSSDEDNVSTAKGRSNQAIDSDDLYDPYVDDRNEEWLVKKVGKQTKSNSSDTNADDTSIMSSDAIISCPMCFTVLSYQTQRHERYPTQYRAIFVENVKVSTTERLVTKPPKNINRMMSEQGNTTFRPVECAICGTHVAVIEEDEEIYHFFQVIAG